MIIFSSLFHANDPCNIEIQPEFHYVTLVGCASLSLLAWHAFKIFNMKKELKSCHSGNNSSSENTSEALLIFKLNSYQAKFEKLSRKYPEFLEYLIIGGIGYPIPTALSGAIWVASQVSFCLCEHCKNEDQEKENPTMWTCARDVSFSAVTICACAFVIKRSIQNILVLWNSF